MLKVNQPRLNLEKQLDAFGKSLPDQCLVLDAGAGDQSNARFFSHCIYESVDFGKVEKMYATPTYACDLREIPVPNSRYDVVVFSQVMEHLPYPQQVAIELARTLKPGGLLFYSAPLSFHEHEVPYDFYRYTQFGVRHIFTEAGFEVPEVLWLEGYLGTVSYQLTRMRKKIPSTARAYGGGLTGFSLQ
jgi:SAM-dependent methyltransferase